MSTERLVDALRRRTPDSVSVPVLALTVLLFATLPFHWQLVWGPASINMSYGDLVVAVVGLGWLLGLLGRRRLPKYALAIAAFVAIGVLSFSLAAVRQPYYFSASAGAVTMTKFAGSVAWMVAAYALARGRTSRVVPVGAAISVVVALAFAGWTVYSAVVWDLIRAEGPFNNPNIYGHYLMFNACLALYLQSTWRDSAWTVVRWLCVLTVPVFAIAVVTTESRGSMLGLAGATATIVLLYSRRVDTVTLLAVVAGLGTTFLAAVAALSYRGVFFLTHFRSRLFRGIDNRLEMWSVALEAARSSPIVGIGYGQVPPLLSIHTGKGVVAHNVYVTIGAETGVIGLAVFVGLLAWVALDGWALASRAPAAVFLVAIVGGTAAQGVGTGVDNFRSFWVAVGLVAAYDADVFATDFTPGELARSVVDRLSAFVDR